MKPLQQNGHTVPENQPTPAAEWRRSRIEGYVITLPSGNKATLRSVPLDQLMQKGEIPDFLTPVAARSLWAESDPISIAENQDLNKNFLKLIDMIVPMAIISPKVVENPQEGREEISIDDVDFYDKVAIFNLAIQSTSVLKNFRDQQKASLEGISDSEDNKQQT